MKNARPWLLRALALSTAVTALLFLLLATPPTGVTAEPVRKCAVNFDPPLGDRNAEPLFAPLNGTARQVVMDQECKYVYLTNETLDQIEVFSLRKGTLESPIPVGPMPWGLDLTPDGSTLYVTNSGSISVVDLGARQELQRIAVPANSSNDRPYSIAIANNGLALFTTTFGGSGFGGRMMELDLATGAVSERADFWTFGGSTTESTHLNASGDRSKIAIVVGGIDSPPVFVYTGSTDSFSPARNLPAPAGFGDIAMDLTGSTILVNMGGDPQPYPGTFVLDANLNTIETIYTGGAGHGVAVDPSGDFGYSVDRQGIVVLALKTSCTSPGCQAIGGRAFGDTVTDPRPNLGVAGRLEISADGRLLVVTTDNGFSLVKPGLCTKTAPGRASGCPSGALP